MSNKYQSGSAVVMREAAISVASSEGEAIPDKIAECRFGVVGCDNSCHGDHNVERMLHDVHVESAMNWAREVSAFGDAFPGAKSLEILLAEIVDLRSRIENAERERQLMRPVVDAARRWYWGGKFHNLGVHVTQYENVVAPEPLVMQSAQLLPSANQGKADG